jgi:hypothetical protein
MTYPKRLHWLGALFMLGTLLARAPAPARAHGGPPRLELNSGRLSPGGTLEVRGINIAPEFEVDVLLTGDGWELILGQAEGDAHGDFMAAYVMPGDLAGGDYLVVVRGPAAIRVSAPLRIEGNPVAAGDAEGGIRDEDEPLLATLPPGWSPPTQAPAVQTAPTQTATPASLWPNVALAVGGLALAGLGLRLRPRRPPAA